MPKPKKDNIVHDILQQSSQTQTTPQPNIGDYNGSINKNKKYIWIAVCGLVIIAGLLFELCLYRDFLVKNKKSNKKDNVILNQEKDENFETPQIKKFNSEEEFKEYLTKAPQSSYYGFFNASVGMNTLKSPDTEFSTGFARDDVGSISDVGLASTKQALTSSVDRVSQTNVQVLNIDESDIVKTDGKYIYFSSNNSYSRSGGVVVDGIVLSERTKTAELPRYTSDIKIIKALPIEDLELVSKIERAGEMFLYDKMLVIFQGKEIYGYDISNIKSPEQKWNITLDKSRIVQSRMYNDKIYLVTVNSINEFSPCPIVPLSVSGKKVNIMCSDIYYPETPINTDSTFIAMKINPQDGNIEDKISFIGSASNSVVYMSENNLYITYHYSDDIIKFFYNFINEEARIFSQKQLSRN